MNRASSFSYQCNRCGRCCHDKVITLSPVDIIGMARAAGITTGEALRLYTLRRGSLLRFGEAGACSALANTICSLHRGRPLACRLYPLGLERVGASERFVTLEPASGSLGVYGEQGIVGDFLIAEGVTDRLNLQERYRPLIELMRSRVMALTDFDRIDPREFWRGAVREALAESGFEINHLIEGLFDPDSFGRAQVNDEDTVAAHVAKIAELIDAEQDSFALASAAVLLAVSLGYGPAEAIGTVQATT